MCVGWKAERAEETGTSGDVRTLYKITRRLNKGSRAHVSR